jgi:hypothetical protein
LNRVSLLMRDVWLFVNQMIRWYGVEALLKYRDLIIPQDP